MSIQISLFIRFLEISIIIAAFLSQYIMVGLSLMNSNFFIMDYVYFYDLVIDISEIFMPLLWDDLWYFNTNMTPNHNNKLS